MKVILSFIFFGLLSNFSFSQVTEYDSSLVNSCLLNSNYECGYPSNARKTFLIRWGNDSVIVVLDSSLSDTLHFSNYSKTIFHLDQFHNVSEEIIMDGDSDSWVNSARYDFNYDQFGNVIMRTALVWSVSDSSWD
jgi:hypothetical protein